MSAEHNLVSIETQSEYSVTTGRRETRIFVKMYVDAVHSGLLADIGDENWRTLCVIAAFMDERGECYPTQELIAHRLGVSRETAGRRIKRLLAYRWQGREVIRAIKERDEGGRWRTTRYTVLPISQLAIFGGEGVAT
ncbi:helix-turn-helix domain-containing protein [Brevibacillus borstelensis]